MRPGFYVCHQAWTWSAWKATQGLSHEVVVGLYDGESGCDFEFSFRWKEGLDFCTLHLHDDGFKAFHDPRFAMLWALLGGWNGGRMTPDMLLSWLVQCGFDDRTERERPVLACEVRS